MLSMGGSQNREGNEGFDHAVVKALQAIFFCSHLCFGEQKQKICIVIACLTCSV